MLKKIIPISCAVIIGLGSLDGFLASRVLGKSTDDSQASAGQYSTYSQAPAVTTTPTSSDSGTGTNVDTSTGSNSSTTTPNTDSTNTSTSANQAEAVTTNWSGYVSTGGTYTAISGSWVVPSVTVGDDSLAADATWIGIGGVSASDLIQVGTENIVQNGQVTGDAFYEQLPDTSQTLSTVDVNAGDSVSASLSEIGNGEWTVTLTDNTNGESYTNTVYYASSQSSAEWIEEAPTDQEGIMSLDQFGSLSFTGGSTEENGTTVSIAGSDPTAVTMINDEEQALATPSALTNGGFTVTRSDASSSAVNGEGPGANGWSRRQFR